jgi:hypothetical protein
MKTIEEINNIMSTIPKEWQTRWCGGENGACACMGCVQIGNRIIMYEKNYDKKFFGDPEYIDESRISQEIYEKYKINKDEWKSWAQSNGLRKES